MARDVQADVMARLKKVEGQVRGLQRMIEECRDCSEVVTQLAAARHALAHAALPGVCLSFLLFHSKHPVLLLLGAMVTGWLALKAIQVSVGQTRIKEDTALALVLSTFLMCL